jgi:hypothetical protein
MAHQRLEEENLEQKLPFIRLRDDVFDFKKKILIGSGILTMDF